jgi:hypothetical protein
VAIIRCIYCTETKQSSREHVLQRALGGNLVERFVCDDCNNAFSTIDQALAERSIVALSRVAQTPSTAFKVVLGGLSTYYDSEQGIFLELQVRNELTPAVLAQVHLRKTGEIPGGAGAVNVEIKVAGLKEDLNEFVKFVDDLMQNNKLRSLHVFIGIPSGNTTSAALVMRREGEGYVRLPAREDAEWFYKTWEQNWETILEQIARTPAPAIPHPNPEIGVSFVYKVNDVYRAIAKTAFNTLASKIGARIFDKAFDPMRRYILGELQLPTARSSDEIAVDSRFVQEIPQEERQLDFTDEHAVVFGYSDPNLIAFVALYGDHLFLVRFPPVAGLPLDELSGHSFTISRSGNEALDFESIAARLIEKGPERFGLELDVANRMAAVLRKRSGTLS